MEGENTEDTTTTETATKQDTSEADRLRVELKAAQDALAAKVKAENEAAAKAEREKMSEAEKAQADRARLERELSLAKASAEQAAKDVALAKNTNVLIRHGLSVEDVAPVILQGFDESKETIETYVARVKATDKWKPLFGTETTTETPKGTPLGDADPGVPPRGTNSTLGARPQVTPEMEALMGEALGYKKHLVEAAIRNVGRTHA